ncbi:MAG: PKD domain-containing protein [Cytophagales bacterium]|nr:MAG: PKD domain-containing protein [Cytophagales bacterium]
MAFHYILKKENKIFDMRHNYLILLLITFILCYNNKTIQAKNPSSVTITAPTLNNLCPNATNYVGLNNIQITEGINTDIALGSSQSIVLAMPSGIELKSGVGSLDLGLVSDNLSGGFIFVSSNAVFITFNANAGSETKLNTIKIIGLQVKANSAVVGTVNMTYTAGSTASILGLSAGAIMASFSTATLPAVTFVWPLPNLTVSTFNTPINLAGAGLPIGGVFSGNGVSGNLFTPSSTVAGSHIITYTYTDGNNCQASASVTILVTTNSCQGNPVPTPNITGLTSVCNGQSNVTYSVSSSLLPGSLNNNFQWAVTEGSIIGSSTGSSITVNWAGNPSYAVTSTGIVSVTQEAVYPASSSCIGTESTNVTIRPNPRTGISGAGIICEGDTRTFNSLYDGEMINNVLIGSPPYTYSWAVENGTFTPDNSTNPNSIVVVWGSAGAGKVTLTKRNANGCVGVSPNPFTIRPKPNPLINSVTPSTLCANKVGVTYNTNNNVGSTYLWTISGGTITSGENTNAVVVNWGAANQNASISVKETNSLGCEKTFTLNITIIAIPTPPVITIGSGQTSVCVGSLGNVYSASGNGSFVWSVTNGTITDGQNTNQIKVTWENAGMGSIGVTITNPTGCQASNSQGITINSLPVSIISNNTQVCALSTGVTYSSTQSGNIYSWDVSGGVITNGQTASTVTVNWGNAGVGIVKLTETVSITNCIKISSNNIAIHPLPAPSIEANSNLFSVCAGSTEVYKVVNSLTNQNYTWVVTGGTIQSGQGTKEISVNWGTNPTGEVKLTQIDNTFATNCSKLDSKDIIIKPLPTPSIIGNTTVCAFEPMNTVNNTFTYTTSLVGGHLYNWTIGSNGNIVTGQGTNTITVRWNNTGSGYINTLMVTQNSNATPNCIVSTQINVNVKPVPVLNINVTNLCFRNTTTFTPSVINPAWTWNWSIISDGFVSADTIPTFVFANIGIKTLTLTVTNPDSCQYTITKTFTIHPAPIANFNYTGNCLPNVTTFSDSSSVNTANDIIVSRTWDFGDGNVLSGNNTNPTHAYTTMGKYNVSLTVLTNNGCNNTFTQEIVLFPSFSPNDASAYFESFENNNHGWVAGSYNTPLTNTWAVGVPSPTRNIQSTTGKVWTTGLNANYSNSQRSYVESPCFNLQGLSRPMLTIKKWSDSEQGLDGTVILYTTNQGVSWKVLGDVGQGSDWYNADNIISSPGPSGLVNILRVGWTGKNNQWIDTKFALDNVKAEAGANSVRFRVAFSSNADNLSGTWDGFAFDDVSIANRDGKVLLEHFTNMASTTENNYVNTFQPEAIKLQYHTNFLNDNDKLYQENKADGGARALTYGISTAPRGAMNGKSNFAGPFSVWGSQAYERNSLNSPKFEINISFPTLPNDKLNINVQVKANRTYNKPVVVHIVLVEKEVTSAQLGLAGTTIYRNVVRKMLPSAGGTTYYGNWILNDIQNFSQSIPIYSVTQENSPKFYDWNNLSVVAFIQDYETLEILQSDEKSPTTLPSLISAVENEVQKQCWIYPNPTSNNVFIGFKEEISKKHEWEIYNMQGIKINNGIILEGKKGVNIDVAQYPKAMYIIKIIEPSQKTVWQSKLQIR